MAASPTPLTLRGDLEPLGPLVEAPANSPEWLALTAADNAEILVGLGMDLPPLLLTLPPPPAPGYWKPPLPLVSGLIPLILPCVGVKSEALRQPRSVSLMRSPCEPTST